MRDSNGVRVNYDKKTIDHKKKSDWVRVHHERKSDGVRVDHEKER